MQPGEIVAARMSGGISIGRVLAVEASRVRISVRRNKDARIPAERVILTSGVVAPGDEEVERFRQQSEDAASSIDITELWEVVRDEGDPMSLDDLAALYWGTAPEAVQRAALLLYLDRDSLHFVSGKEGYTPRSQEAVQETLARRQREASNARDSEELATCLSQGRLPDEITPHQRLLLEHLKGFAAHGDNYTRSAAVKDFLNGMERSRGDLQRLSFDLLVGAGVFEPDEPLELEREGIVQEFPEEAIQEAGAIDPSSIVGEPHRRDLTALPVVSIDDADTEDKDDALSLEIETPEVESETPDFSPRDRETPGAEVPGSSVIYRIGIHITDAGALIPQGSALDQEADRRMATLYMPERKVTMLPADVANDRGSLEPGATRAALSLLARVSGAGEVLDWEVAPSVIKSQAALSYDEVDQAVENKSHPWHKMISALDGVARSLKGRREEAGAINLDRPEMSIKLSSSGEVSVRVVPRSTPSRQMVAEFMVLCNSLLAEFCRREDLPASYRSQTAPDLSDLGADLPAGVELSDGHLRWYLTMRRLSPADISTTPAPHGGLGVSAYIQATSPLRRYPDLVMQRQISHFLNNGRPLYSTEEVASVAHRADVQVRGLAKIEDERKRYWLLKYLDQERKAGNSDRYEAVVLENQPNRTAQLELVEYPFRVRAQLPSAVLPGSTVTLQLHGVDLWRKIGHFVYVPGS